MANESAEVLARRLENSADFLALASKFYGEIDWTLPVIERRFTIEEVLRQTAEHLRKDSTIASSSS